MQNIIDKMLYTLDVSYGNEYRYEIHSTKRIASFNNNKYINNNYKLIIYTSIDNKIVFNENFNYMDLLQTLNKLIKNKEYYKEYKKND